MTSQRNPLYWIDVAVFLAFGSFVVTHATWHARQIIGTCIAIAGFTLWMTARFQLGGSFTVTAQAKKLVTTGLYSKFRNPIYLFGGVSFAGLFIVIGDPILFLLFLLFYSHQLWRIRKEGKVLEQAFGEDYRRYKAKTWF
ncbi:MAG TPA: isoprenylcysteine carboxylmethyltransferase family protein [Candidatus Acidoferrales bacterium]|nr:isoprenylcysteine carboxylmethyltransferase family protein [Candidatus Acidoferrales bacterium]